MAKRAEIELVADDRKFAQKLRDARKKWAAFGQGLTKGAGNVAKGTHKAFSRIAGSTLGKLTQVAGFAGTAALVGSEVRNTMRFEEALTRLKIQAGAAMGSTDAFRRSVMNVSNATGLAREEVLAGQTAYVTLTGDVATASASMDLFAKIAKGSGASMDDIAGSAAALKQNLGIDPTEFERAFSILVHEGKAGSVELRDMASLMAKLAPQFAEFAGGKGVEGMADLGGALQVVNHGFNDADEAATALSGLMTSLTKNAGRFKAAGVDVFTTDASGVKHLRSVSEIVDAIGASKLAKDPQALTKALGRAEAYRAYLQLRNNREEWRKLGEENLNAKDVAEDYAAFQDSASGRMQAAWVQLKNTIAAAFTPERIQAFIQFLGFAVEMAGKLVDTLSNVPGYIEFLEGEGKVASQDASDAFEKLATDPVMQKFYGVGQAGKKITPTDLNAIAEKVVAAGPDELGGDTATRENIVAGARARLSNAKAQRRAAIEAGRDAFSGLGTGERLAGEGGMPAYDDTAPAGFALSETGRNVNTGKVQVTVDAAPGLSVKIDNDPKQLVGAP